MHLNFDFFFSQYSVIWMSFATFELYWSIWELFKKYPNCLNYPPTNKCNVMRCAWSHCLEKNPANIPKNQNGCHWNCCSLANIWRIIIKQKTGGYSSTYWLNNETKCISMRLFVGRKFKVSILFDQTSYILQQLITFIEKSYMSYGQ